MLKFCSLYSGSSGNSFFVESNNSKILIDAGVSCKKIVDALASINVDISSIDAIFITHEHTDHTQSVGTISKKYNIPVYANKETFYAIPLQTQKILPENIHYFKNNNEIIFKDLKIFPFTVPHDAANPCGFNIYNSVSKISIATDIGHMDNSVLNNLKHSKFILLESNYEPAVLKCSPYPYKLKERIASPLGHLSNIDAGKTINYLSDFGLEKVMLGHLSKENNFPELAYKSVLEQINNNKKLELEIASRFEPSSFFEVS